MEAIATALKNSIRPFLWVVKKPDYNSPDKSRELPLEFKEMIKNLLSSPASVGRKTHSAHFSLHFEWCWVAPSWCSAEKSVLNLLDLSRRRRLKVEKISRDEQTSTGHKSPIKASILVSRSSSTACYESNIEAHVVYEVRKIMEISFSDGVWSSAFRYFASLLFC
ncbi:hypothetical protein LWI29_029738 [Acer saccharum]|uniref:Uncharacterized protein n=1 Tax=Acer saccharum TaxID=4024 RepID=A0AA39VDQ6_ACESA|nr:hypothetical protein LWI29_029738 [Acer saccharum]